MLLPVWAKWGGDRVEGRKAITLVGFYRNGSQFLLQLPRWCSGKESTCQCRRCGFDPWVGKIPWRRKWQPTPVFLPGESHGQRSLGGYNPQGLKELDTTEQAACMCYILCIVSIASNMQNSLWICTDKNDLKFVYSEIIRATFSVPKGTWGTFPQFQQTVRFFPKPWVDFSLLTNIWGLFATTTGKIGVQIEDTLY